MPSYEIGPKYETLQSAEQFQISRSAKCGVPELFTFSGAISVLESLAEEQDHSRL